jgi:hypothetical protein
MVKIKKFKELFESETILTPEQKDFLDFGFKGKSRWILDGDGLVNSSYPFDITGENMKDFMGIKFGSVDSYFNISNNLFTSLKGSPSKVRYTFRCNNNKLQTLKGCPDEIGQNFDCSHNQIKTLMEGPKRVIGNYNCSHNLLKNLEGLPEFYFESLYFGNNEIVSLKGISDSVTNGCNGENNPLSEGAIHTILPIVMKSYSYEEALAEVWDKLDDEDKALLYPDLEMKLPQEEIERLNIMSKYNKVKHML